MERIPEWAFGGFSLADRRLSASFDWLVLVNQQVRCSSTSVGGDRRKETRERGVITVGQMAICLRLKNRFVSKK